MSGASRNTLETVMIDTPARCAMSLRRIINGLLSVPPGPGPRPLAPSETRPLIVPLHPQSLHNSTGFTLSFPCRFQRTNLGALAAVPVLPSFAPFRDNEVHSLVFSGCLP